MIRMLNQSKLRLYWPGKIYKYGFEVPRNPRDCIRIDNENSNKRWQESMALEISQLQEYGTFKSLGYKAATPNG